MELRRVLVHFRILPAITKIGLIAVIHRKSFPHENAETLGRFSIVLVDLGNAFRKVVHHVIHRVSKRDIDKRPVGKYTLDFAPEAGIESIVVVDVQKSASREKLTEPDDLGFAKAYVSVTCNVQERIVPEPVIHERHASFRTINFECCTPGNSADEIGKTGWIRVPVSATIVLESGDGQPRLRTGGGEKHSNCCSAKNHVSWARR